MSYEKRADYKKTFLFPPSIEDWIAADHPARFIREFVDALDLEELGIKRRETEEGRPSYAADLLIKVWLYGYCNEIRSVRKLEQACRENVGLIWLTGMNEPDHNTLWRFWRENKKAVGKLFIEAVQVATRANIVGAVLQMVDGTKIQARASRKAALRRRELEELLKKIEKSFEQTGEKENQGYRLPESLRDREALRKKVNQALSELKEIDRNAINAKEPEAREVKCGRVTEFGYNAQVVVDDTSGLIVAADVVNDESDNELLAPMVEQARENVGRADEVVADGGYASGRSLHKAEMLGQEVLVNLGKNHSGGENEFHTSRFHYDAEKDCCVCPRGEVLTFAGTTYDKGRGYRARVYRCNSFVDCPVRWQCSSNIKGRRVRITPFDAALRKQRHKQLEPRSQALLRRRMAVVEQVFGQIKWCSGFRRFTVAGLVGVKAQWLLIATAFNLKKLLPYWADGRLTFNTG